MSAALWLHDRSFSSAQRSMLENYMRKSGFNPAEVFFASIHFKVKDLWVRKGKTKDTWICNPAKKQEFFHALDEYIETIKPKILIVNDKATLGFITGYTSLDLCRGSVYRYNSIPVIVIDDILKTKSVKYAPWILLSDLNKAKRWVTGTKYPEPKFSYKVSRTREDLFEAEQFLRGCFFMSCDIETKSNFISCIGYTGVNEKGQVKTFVIPLFNPTKVGNAHWENEEDELTAWEIIRSINDNDAIKCFQNGQYDCAYLIRYRVPPRNYLTDTLHIWHSIWTEAPKKLNFISSMVIDHCRYWKDESKGDKKDQQKGDAVPSDPIGLEKYWRYNALDCHNTFLAARWLLVFLARKDLDWARANYNTEFRLQVGPALAMTMRGIKMDRKRQLFKYAKWIEEYHKELDSLRVMCDDPEFSPSSPYQVASLIYDVLGAQPIKKRGQKSGARSTDESMLKLVRTQHPIFAAFIDKIWAVKKPLNNASKYGEMRTYNGRFIYKLSAAGTETGRFASAAHHFWMGTNAQNIPAKHRDMLIPDDGYILFEADYSQSDGYFVAFESEEPKMMQNMTDDRDTHCVHAEFFFKVPYEKLMAEIKEPWVKHPTKGVRSNTKRIVHGSNYRMAAFTLYVTMGHEAVIETAKALGHANAHRYTQNQLVAVCQQLLDAYLEFYPGLPVWFDTSVQEAVQNGNRACCFGGRTRLFFGDLLRDQKLQRELSAYYGQGGTSGNINRTLLDIYYKSDLEKEGLMLLNQVHDSILFQVPINRIDLAEKFLTMMEQECIVKGRKFTVPVEAECGFSWKGGFVDYKRGQPLDLFKVFEAEYKNSEKYLGTLSTTGSQ